MQELRLSSGKAILELPRPAAELEETMELTGTWMVLLTGTFAAGMGLMIGLVRLRHREANKDELPLTF